MSAVPNYGNFYLLYLAWPESCFRVTASDIAFLRNLVKKGSMVVSVGSDKEFLKLLPRATHVITWHFSAEWYERAPRLRVLATPAAGRELVPEKAPKGVKLHFGGFHGEIISEATLGFVLAWSHGFFRTEPLWPRSLRAPYSRQVAGTRAVIVGYGKIGRAVGAKLSALGIDVFGYSRHLKIAEKTFESRLKTADWLILALPGTQETDNFLDARRLALLPPRAVVVNVGRGNAVDEAALLKALVNRRLAGAWLDVFGNEPTVLAKGGVKKPACDLANRRHVPLNLIRTPHASAFASDYMKRCFLELQHDRCL